MNLLKVKDNEDFIFKFVILFLIFLFCYITIFLYYNYNYLFSYREGLETGEAYVVSKENKTDLGGGDNDGGENTDENAAQNNNQQEETIKVNSRKADLLKQINLAFSNADGNRDKTLEKIEWFKNFNKGMILNKIYSSADSSVGINTNDVVNRLEINKAFESGEIDKLIASFPLIEAESNSMSSGSGSGGFF